VVQGRLAPVKRPEECAESVLRFSKGAFNSSLRAAVEMIRDGGVSGAHFKEGSW